MIFDPSIPQIGYAPDEEEAKQDDYPQEDNDMDKYYELKNVEE